MKNLIIEVPDDWKDHHAVDWEWLKANAKEAVEVHGGISRAIATQFDSEVKLYAVEVK